MIRLANLYDATGISINARADYTWVETQGILTAISSTDPEDEDDSSKPVYMPFKGLTDVARNFVRNRISGATYAPDYEFELTWRTGHAGRAKSIVDVVYLYELCRALRTVIGGKLVSHRLASISRDLTPSRQLTDKPEEDAGDDAE